MVIRLKKVQVIQVDRKGVKVGEGRGKDGCREVDKKNFKVIVFYEMNGVRHQ